MSEQPAKSTRQLLFYEQATPVTVKRHGDWSVELGKDYAFARRINALDLLEPVQANVALEGGKRFSLTDFKVISRERLKQIDATALGEMFAADDLELVYLHLHSLNAFSGLLDRVKGGQSSP